MAFPQLPVRPVQSSSKLTAPNTPKYPNAKYLKSSLSDMRLPSASRNKE